MSYDLEIFLVAESLKESFPLSNPLIIKICGITNVEDGLAALEAGADWLGFVRWPKSSRHVDRDDAAGLLQELRRRVPRPFEAVAVYVDADRETILTDREIAGFDRVQLHGMESPEFARALPCPVLKALRVRDAPAARELADRYAGLDLLCDAFDDALPGGTGRAYDYSILSELVAERRIVVAGGWHPGNVGDIVARLRPWGVDVSSGVESAPGRKDADRVRRFIEAARAADARR